MCAESSSSVESCHHSSSPLCEVLAEGVEIWLGDCRDVLPMIGRVDAVVTDPPYGIGIAANPVRQKHEKKDWDASAPDGGLFGYLIAISDYQIIWGGNYFPLGPSQGFLVWDKVQPENFSLSMCEQAWTNIRTPAKLFRRRVVSFSKEHPTQKPLELMEWCIGFLPNDCSRLLDPYMGSGTTGCAAVRRGRKFIGIERDPGYFDIARRRISEALKQPDFFVERPAPIKQDTFL